MHMDLIWFFLTLTSGIAICWGFWWRQSIQETRLLRMAAQGLSGALETRNNSSKGQQNDGIVELGGPHLIMIMICNAVGAILMAILAWGWDRLTAQFGGSAWLVVVIAIWFVFFAVAKATGRHVLLWVGPITACAVAGFRLIPAADLDSLKQLQATSEHMTVKLALPTVFSIARAVPLFQVGAAGVILLLIDLCITSSRDQASSALRGMHYLLPTHLIGRRRRTPIASVVMYSAWLTIYAMIAIIYFSSQPFVSQTDKSVAVYFFSVTLTTLLCWIPMVLIDGQNNANVHRRQSKQWFVASLIFWTVPPGAWLARWIVSLV